MKTLYYWFIKRTNWILSTFLGILGFTTLNSCEQADEYGTPYSNFIIKGKVVNEWNKPIPEIRVNVVPLNVDYNMLKTDELTNAQGEFEAIFESSNGWNYQIIAKDADGEENGSFENDTTAISFTKNDYIRSGKGWYSGDALKIVNIVLKEKKEN